MSRAFFIFFGVKTHHPGWLALAISPAPAGTGSAWIAKRDASRDRAGIIYTILLTIVHKNN
jgi:hypothetical protein